MPARVLRSIFFNFLMVADYFIFVRTKVAIFMAVSSSPIYLLAIESSCDDTAAAVLLNGKVLSNCIAGQEIHQKYGGVVPELASRAHQQNIVPVVDTALKEAGIQVKQLSAVAVTKGPGLLGSLLVGMSFAKSLSQALNIPLIEVHHMHAHILAHFIEGDQPPPDFPFLALTASGGHTQIVQVNDHFDMKILGQTQDDAVGEAFDKSAKLLGLPYPGGPQLDKLAQKGDAEKFTFTKPKMDGYDYSFSGIKTAIMYFLNRETQKNPNFIQNNLTHLCASIQKTLIDILLDKLFLAAKETQINQIAIGGGVSANSLLRRRITEWGQKTGRKAYIPPFAYTTDNAAMVGIAGYLKYLQKDFSPLNTASQARYAF